MSGYDETKRLDVVCERMARLVARGEFHAVGLAVGVGGTQVAEWYEGEAAPGLPAGPEVLWPLASISKSYTATAIMALVEHGDLTLSLPAHALLPVFSGDGREGVRLGHLLTHTAGLIYESPQMEELLRRQMPLGEIVDEAYTHPLMFTPGTRYNHSDYGYALAARMAEVAAGRPFPEIVRERVLEPGELHETFFPPPTSECAHVAQVEGALASGSEGAMYNTPYALALAHPAFGVVATVRDLLRFGLLFAHGGQRRLLSEAAMQVITTDYTSGLPQEEQHSTFPFRPAPYGIGFLVGRNAGLAGAELVSQASFGHDGASGCVLLVDQAADLTVALVSNRHVRINRERWHFCLGSLINGVVAALTRERP
jgi:CubicO group peptidase (beta-lactamase class C family)